MRLTAIYLARAVNAPHWLDRFLDSLQRHNPGVPYDLTVICKGYEGARPERLTGFDAPGLERVIYRDASDETFATNTFVDVAHTLDHDALLYFVSWSRVLAPDWGRIILDGLEQPRTGIVGASAGWEQLNNDTPFPNRSIRTTGFCILRQRWLALDHGPLTHKYDGNLFEAGPNSMTRQIEMAGERALVAGRDGRFFEAENWAKSATFRFADQENLLFADNRTQQYHAAAMRKRRKLARLTWGEGASVTSIGPLTRLQRYLAWKYGRFTNGI